MGSLRMSCFFGSLVTCVYLPKSARAYLFPQSVKTRYFCSGPISVSPHSSAAEARRRPRARGVLRVPEVVPGRDGAGVRRLLRGAHVRMNKYVSTTHKLKMQQCTFKNTIIMIITLSLLSFQQPTIQICTNNKCFARLQHVVCC